MPNDLGRRENDNYKAPKKIWIEATIRSDRDSQKISGLDVKIETTQVKDDGLSRKPYVSRKKLALGPGKRTNQFHKELDLGAIYDGVNPQPNVVDHNENEYQSKIHQGISKNTNRSTFTMIVRIIDSDTVDYFFASIDKSIRRKVWATKNLLKIIIE